MNDPWWLAGGVSPANCVAAYQPIGADSLQASYLNLANSGTYNAAPGVAPTFDASAGWAFNGTQYLESGFAPVDITSAIVRFSNIPDMMNGNALFGARDTLAYTSNGLFLIIVTDSFNWIYACNGGYNQVTPKMFNGVIAIANRNVYRNGVFSFDINNDWVTVTTTKKIILGGWRPGDAVYCGISNIQAIAFYNTTLTAGQVAAISIAIEALTGASLPTHHMPSTGMRRWARLYVGQQFNPAWARNSNRIITPGVMLP